MHKKSLFIFTSLLFILNVAHAQSTFNSPYSRFGVGDLNQDKNLKNTAMGGISAGDRNPTSINISNPASYSAFDTLSFVFETGLSGNFNLLSTTSAKQNNSNFGIRNLLFGFPISKGIGACFGLLPYSNSSYSINSTQNVDSVNGSINYKNTGSGGLNQLFFGTAFLLNKNLSIGANITYIFGSINQERDVIFPADSNYFNTYVMNKIKVNDVKFDLGFQYKLKFTDDYSLTLGGTYSLKKNLSATNTELARRYTPIGGSSSTYVRDTVVNETLNKGNITFPDGFKAGFLLQKANNWAFGMDFSKTNWSNYKTFGINDSLVNETRISTGLEYIPNFKSKNIFMKTRYRLGYHYGNSYLNLSNTQLKEYGVSLGFGIPVRNLRSGNPNIINLVFEYGSMGTTANNLIKEDYFKISFGINFNERWFQKHKYE